MMMIKGKDLGRRKRRGKRREGKKGDEGVNAGQGRERSGKGRREGREDRGAKYLCNNRLLEEGSEERGRRALTQTWRKGRDGGREKEMWRRNAEPEVSIDLDMTNERRLILRRRHPRQKSPVVVATFKTPLKDISYRSQHVQLAAYLIKKA